MMLLLLSLDLQAFHFKVLHTNYYIPDGDCVYGANILQEKFRKIQKLQFNSTKVKIIPSGLALTKYSFHKSLFQRISNSQKLSSMHTVTYYLPIPRHNWIDLVCPDSMTYLTNDFYISCLLQTCQIICPIYHKHTLICDIFCLRK